MQPLFRFTSKPQPTASAVADLSLESDSALEDSDEAASVELDSSDLASDRLSFELSTASASV